MSSIVLTRKVPVYITDYDGALAPTEDTLVEGLEIRLNPERKEAKVIFLSEAGEANIQNLAAYHFSVNGFDAHGYRVLERDIQDMIQSPSLVQTAL